MVNLHKIKPRLQSPILAQVQTQYPVVVVHGARQTGKTTLVQESPICQGRTFLSLDDFDVRDVAQSDPAALFIGRERITLDEIQRQPDLLLAIKADVDRQRQPGRFLLDSVLGGGLVLFKGHYSLLGRDALKSPTCRSSRDA